MILLKLKPSISPNQANVVQEAEGDPEVDVNSNDRNSLGEQQQEEED